MSRGALAIKVALIAAFSLGRAAAQGAPSGPPGSLDASFGTGGKVLTVIGGGSAAAAMEIQADLRIVLAGSAFTGVKSDFAVARYKANGKPDNAFGTQGVATASVGPTGDAATGVGIDGAGRIVAAGFTQQPAGYDFGTVRWTAGGTLDAAFGAGGIVVTDFNGGIDLARAGLVVQADDKPVVMGEAQFSSTPALGLARYTVSGALDPTFGTGGKVTTLVFNTVNDRLFGGTLQADGKIVGTGHAWTGTRTDTVVARYNTDGTLDAGFGSGGTVVTVFGGGLSSSGLAAVVQPDGKIVVAGSTTSPNGSFKVIAVSRYLANGSLDAGFGTGGLVTTPVPGEIGDQEANAVTLQADGKIVVAGYQNTGFNTKSNFLLVRYDSNGALDATFGQAGLSVISLSPTDDIAKAVKIHSNGRIVAAGSSSLNGLGAFGMVRVMP
jgi:uncharacterized delta-60 repeat protein